MSVYTNLSKLLLSGHSEIIQLVSIEMHDGVKIIGKMAFHRCISLRGIKLPGVRVVEKYAFDYCTRLSDLQFGDKLEIIEDGAFVGCSLRSITIPTVRTIGERVFAYCRALTDADFGDKLETIGQCAFDCCDNLQRIAIPLKRDLFEIDNEFQKYTQFYACDQLTTVDLVGGTQKTVSSLHMESWKTELSAEINRINQVLPTTPADEKTNEIQQWMESLLDKMDHYKAEHHRYVKEGITLLELALWKANLEDKEADRLERVGGIRTRGSRKRARKEISVTSGAGIVIKNVLPFLQLE